MPLQQKMVSCFWCKNMGWRRGKSSGLFLCTLPIIKAVLLLMDRQRKCVASECGAGSEMNWNSTILNIIETVLKTLCNLYVLIKKKKKKKKNQASYLKICIVEADMELCFFPICWAVGCIASLANIIRFLRLPAVCLRQDCQLPTVRYMHNTGFYNFFGRILVLVDHEEKALCDNFFESLLNFFQWNVRLLRFIFLVRKY